MWGGGVSTHIIHKATVGRKSPTGTLSKVEVKSGGRDHEKEAAWRRTVATQDKHPWNSADLFSLRCKSLPKKLRILGGTHVASCNFLLSPMANDILLIVSSMYSVCNYE